ncbi:MAG: DsbA family protein [bacterium]|nr:DsbA family protein [bacterium]
MEFSPSPLLLLNGYLFGFHLYMRPGNIKKNIIDTNIEALEAPTISIINPARGPSDAAVTIVEFGDYQCEFCRDLEASIEIIRRENPDQIRVVWKDFPNEQVHTLAISAAVAARCASDQGRFWDYHDILFTQINSLGASTYKIIAEALELDMDQFTKCTETEASLPRVQRDFEEGLDLKLIATPTIFINEKRFVGAVSLEELRKTINPLLSL